MPDTNELILMGNEAIGRGLVEFGCHFVSAYPGTPSSEILPAVVRFKRDADWDLYTEWSINEKVALETALAVTYTGKRAACAMKQVGLNVAADPMMSASYIGVIGGFVIISADDPGPHSSQTEQDTRLFAMLAKMPVFDPSSPAEARDMIGLAFEYSEKFEIPILFRPTLRVCHARQNIALKKPQRIERRAAFPRNPFRWAATPKFRLGLHHELNDKLERIAAELCVDERLNRIDRPRDKAPVGIIAAGISSAVTTDVLSEMGRLDETPMLKIATAYPFPEKLVNDFIDACDRVLIIEETDPVIEMQIRDKSKITGRLDGVVPSAGELMPEVVAEVLESVLDGAGGGSTLVQVPDQAPPRRPSLCPGCPHRASFYAIRRAFPDGPYPSDIGCYTLGMNLGAVDTCHNMGAAISFAASFAHAYRLDGQKKPVIATIGDSTFYHSGLAPLVNAVYNDVRFVLVILDNEITGMTGMQPTPEFGVTADGPDRPGTAVPLEELIAGCGVKHIVEADPYDVKTFSKVLKKAYQAAMEPDGTVAVVVARHPCVAHRRADGVPDPVRVEIIQDGPAPAKATLDDPDGKCISCNQCVLVCPSGAVTKRGDKDYVIDDEGCVSCRQCAAACPVGVIALEPAGACVACGYCRTRYECPALIVGPQGTTIIDRRICVDCGLCRFVCAHHAIQVAGEEK
ncbi:MAG: 4Fe-4S binding protein [Proteobacteria bacterium]|nr:4Fe-4S binding protein [Pseudomonadota bacterium]MBU1742802.1 4Fe-4S binding protein [Pseudomonadota bacterium]